MYAARTEYTAVSLPEAHAQIRRLKAELLAVVQDTAPPQLAGVISGINHYYGRDEIPIGAYKGGGLTLAGQPPLQFVASVMSSFDSPIRSTAQVALLAAMSGNYDPSHQWPPSYALSSH